MNKVAWISIIAGAFFGSFFSLLFSGLLLPNLTHTPATPRSVDVDIRAKDGLLRVVVRNDSDETVDLETFELLVAKKSLAGAAGAYVEPSNVYSLDSPNVSLEFIDENKIRIVGDLIHSIPPEGRDSFLVKVSKDVDLTRVSGFLEDRHGKLFELSLD